MPADTARTYLVTGALGCLGAWTVASLVADGKAVVGLDQAHDSRRLRQLMSDDDFSKVHVVSADITDTDALERLLVERDITNLIHLAALQVPFCRADPVRGALVNVGGTAAVFEAVRRGSRVERVVYASSIAIYDAADADPESELVVAETAGHPTTLYGVYKQANEGTARVNWLDYGTSSIGLRPPSIYGFGRDQGMTSTPTKAMIAAVLGLPYRITFGGRALFQYAEDTARTFITASESALVGPHLFNLPGSLMDMDEIVAAIEVAVPAAAGTITHDAGTLPFPDHFDSLGLEQIGALHSTTFEQGVAATVERARFLLSGGRLDAREQGIGA